MDLDDLIRIMAALRAEGGCPWDREQTPESLKPFIVEEAYEVLDAIDEQDADMLKEELGDLLFQIVFQCQLARERGLFSMSDVIDSIGRKMTERHPHVFGDAECETTGQVLDQWELLKRREGKMKESVTDGIPKHLPSLMKAWKVQDRVSQVGFDWQRVDDVLAKLEEEIREFKTALQEKGSGNTEDELGDILFSLVNVARFVGLNPEDALRRTISRFISRFRYIEMTAASRKKNLSDMTLEEMDALWDEAKDREAKKNNRLMRGRKPPAHPGGE